MSFKTWYIGVLKNHCQSVLYNICFFQRVPKDRGIEEPNRAAGANFAFVGPLLDKPGAKRAAGLRFDTSLHKDNEDASSEQDPVELVQEARKAGRKVVLASLGTMVTGDTTGLERSSGCGRGASGSHRQGALPGSLGWSFRCLRFGFLRGWASDPRGFGPPARCLG